MNEQELYGLVLEYFKGQLKLTNPQIQIRGVIHGVDDKVKRIQGKTESGYTLSDKQHEIINEIIWDLIIQRVLAITTQGLPWLSVTDFGKKLLASATPIPYDRENYLANIYGKHSSLDLLVKSYLEESLLCLRGGAYRAGVVMLGVSSEQMFTLLVQSFQNKYSLSRPIITQKYRPFSQTRNEFAKKFNPKKADLPQNLQQDLEVILDGIYTLIKNTRDDSGHPTGVNVSREQFTSYLSVFPLYVDRLASIIEFYSKP